MNKEALAELVAQILETMGQPAEKKAETLPVKEPSQASGEMIPDITEIDLRKLYQTKDPADPQGFLRLKERTPARLGSGRAGPRYTTLTQLRFRADHAAARDAVFSQVPEDYAEQQGFVPVVTQCKDKDQYLTRPDLGRRFDEENGAKIRKAIPTPPRVQLVVGDGLSSAAILANAADCLAAIRSALQTQGIQTGTTLFVRYCRIGAGDAIGDLTGCELVCMLVGERPGLVTDKSMSAYITYKPHTGIPESCRTVVSNIHAQGTPAVEAGAFIGELIGKILEKKVSGVGLQL